jgi:hypothetical protein
VGHGVRGCNPFDQRTAAEQRALGDRFLEAVADSVAADEPLAVAGAENVETGFGREREGFFDVGANDDVRAA